MMESKYKERLMGLIPEKKIVTTEIPRPEKRIISEFAEMKSLTPLISDVLDSMGIAGAVPASELKPLQKGRIIVGPAITLRYITEKKTTTQLMLEQDSPKLADRDAYAVAEPGDVVVIDAGGKIISTIGGLSTLIAVRYKMAGSIVDGGVRDIAEILELEYPVWCRGITPISGKYRLEASEINGSVMCAGIQVNPGDLVVADDTGVVFIPAYKIEEVLEKVKSLYQKEERITEAINKGLGLAEFKKILRPENW